jgi:hypothetical protein
MSKVVGSRRAASDHFEPDGDVDGKSHRQLRGHLEQIDYTAYAANKKVLSGTLASVDAEKFQRLGSAAALARARWVVAALAVTEAGPTPAPNEIKALAQLRETYQELTEAYDAMRRMVERGYLTFVASP